MKKICLLPLVIIPFIIGSCSGNGFGGILQGPTPMPGAAQTPLPEAQVLFSLNAPIDTPESASIGLELVDPVTGLGYHGQQFPMEQLASGQWQASLELPLGSLIRYRYLLTEPTRSGEHNLSGQPVDYRVGYIPSSMQFIDQVAKWEASPSPTAGGRIIGRLSSVDGNRPIPEMIITAAGQQTFTDGQGRFRLEGLPAGLNNLVAYHPEGAFRPIQQGAIVADGGTTPAIFETSAAKKVTMTFQVEVPAETPANAPLRLVGNLHSLGDMFAQLPGGVEISAVRAPELIQVDGTHYIFLADMYAGTDLRYKYTLGDGLWNAERTERGTFRTRQIIVPETDAIQVDRVASWREAGAPIQLTIQIPENTPAGETIGLQFDPFTPFEPLPMSSSGEDHWEFTLWSPLSMGQSLQTNFCRNLECGRADADKPLDLQMEQVEKVEHTIENWQWWSGRQPPPTILAPEINARPSMDLGFDLVPGYQPSWQIYNQHAINQMTNSNSNSVTVSPVWLAHSTNGTPLLSFDPGRDRYQIDWLTFAQQATAQGLRLGVRPELVVNQGTLADWWQQSARDNGWWTTAYEEISSFLLTQAMLAESMEADRFILNASQLEPALPGGQLITGEPANQPLNAETYWRQLVTELRAEFSGELVYEFELHEDLSRQPQFFDMFDSAQIYWHAPLSDGTIMELEQLQAEVDRYLELEVLSALPAEIPITVSLEYLSIENSAAACPPLPAGGCRMASEFDLAAQVDPQIEADLLAQVRAINAVLLAIDEQERITGIYMRRYYPLAALQDKSASVHGKPAADLIRYWFQQWQDQ